MRIPKRRKVTDGLAAWATTATGHETQPMQGPITILDDVFTDTMPYGLLEPLPGTTYHRGWGPDWQDASFVYAFIAYGQDVQQAEFMSDLFREKFLDTDIAMDITGFSIIERAIDEPAGTPERAAVDVWEVRESFILRVQAS